MRFPIPILMGFWALMGSAAAQTQVVQKFEGSAPTTTPVFTVGDKWEVVWNSPAPLRITLLKRDGTIVAGIEGVFSGSFYQPKGGSFYLQVDGVAQGAMPPWHLAIEEAQANASPAPAADALAGGGNFVPPTVHPPLPAPAAPAVTNIAVSPPAPAAEPAPAPTNLTEEQARAVVMIEGDNTEGTGFLVKMPDGPAVVTTLDVLASNPHVRILTSTGAQITTLGMKGASDRDLALLPIKDDHYSYLSLDSDVASHVHPGDDIIVPDTDSDDESAPVIPGTVATMGMDRIGLANLDYDGDNGGPVLLAKTGGVVGVAVETPKIYAPSEVGGDSLSAQDSAAADTGRYFGLRLDTVPKWEAYDPVLFQDQTIFLDQFHQQSRRLDSYLNSSPKNGGPSKADDEAGPPSPVLYLTDDKIVKAHTDFMQQAAGGDSAERLDALRAWLFTMDNIADTNVAAIQNLNNFYGFYQQRARQELAYREALKKELDSFGDHVSRVATLGHHN